MTVEVQDIEVDTELKSWFPETSGGKAGRKMWQHTWQGVSDASWLKLIDIARPLSSYPCLLVSSLGRESPWTS